MSMAPSTPLLFPAVVYGSCEEIFLNAEAEGRWCAQQYLQHGTFPLPRAMREVKPGEVVTLDSGTDFLWDEPAWRLYLFSHVIVGVDSDVKGPEFTLRDDAFEVVCRDTPWGALYHAVSPWAPWSAQRMAPRLAALLPFWEVLQGPRYLYRSREHGDTLEQMLEGIYRPTLEAWCPGGPKSLREHLALVAERMARASHEECLEAVLRLVPSLLEKATTLQHREALSDTGFLRERLTLLSPREFNRLSSAYTYAVQSQLLDWDKELRRR